MRVRSLLLVLGIIIVPEVAQACPVCFQGVDSPLLDSARAGVLAMAVVLAGVLGAFGRWFVRLARLEAESTQEDGR
jgi:hypothetical protein